MVSTTKKTSFYAMIVRRILPIMVWTTIPVVHASADVLSAIAHCESGGHQYGPNGEVLRNKINHSVVGLFQINERLHGAVARKLGLNIYTPQGNTAYARYLLQKQGTSPWLASKKCWKFAQR